MARAKKCQLVFTFAALYSSGNGSVEGRSSFPVFLNS